MYRNCPKYITEIAQNLFTSTPRKIFSMKLHEGTIEPLE